MKKGVSKKLAVAGCGLMLCAALAVGGTVAYLTDRDSKANVFTQGDVSIGLEEKFEQNSVLIPGQMVDKECVISNTGNAPAYVWMTVAVPAALDNVKATSEQGVTDTFNVLNWGVPAANWYGHNNPEQVPSEQTWLVSTEEGSLGLLERIEPQKKTIEGVDFNVYTLLYLSALEPGQDTNMALSDVWLDEHVDISPDGTVCWVAEGGDVTSFAWNVEKSGNPTVYVSAYAIQAAGFSDVFQAYQAYQGQWGENGDEYAVPDADKSGANESKGDSSEVNE